MYVFLCIILNGNKWDYFYYYFIYFNTGIWKIIRIIIYVKIVLYVGNTYFIFLSVEYEVELMNFSRIWIMMII